MKSVLVVDTPKTCKECRCQMMLVCVPSDEDIDEYADPNTTIPEWCPLKPMPSRWIPQLNGLGIEQQIRNIDFAGGWNTCLKKITGETE